MYEKKLAIIAKKYNLDLLILFWSRARGTDKPDSDWDFAFFGNISVRNHVLLSEDLSKIVTSDAIDGINISSVSSFLFLFRIFNDGMCMYEAKKGLFSRCKTAARLDYIDYAPKIARRYELIKKQVRAM